MSVLDSGQVHVGPPRGGDVFLAVEGLCAHFTVDTGGRGARRWRTLTAVDAVTFHMARGEILGLVGESGCGKSTLSRAIMQLLPATEGKVVLDGQDLAALDPRSLRRARPDFQMVFQDPYASLDPRMTVFDTVAEAVRTRGSLRGRDLAERVHELMRAVELAPDSVMKYPHEFSGGQRQRIAVARALATRPKLVIADEPVSALDVSIQSQVINLLLNLSKNLSLTMLFISHDLSVVQYISDRIAVMYLGRLVEIGPADEILRHPVHPYTRMLASAIPLPDPDHERSRRRLVPMGDAPSPLDPPTGCAFHPRCSFSHERCSRERPEPCSTAGQRQVACFRAEAIAAGQISEPVARTAHESPRGNC